ncbi:glycosyltransferase family 2 protein [Algoriphagus sp.]|uniref:glycosyltransferase family 2 protein n=1 Tax=Algoriphagus sp. TaxID=1872435 RepID=UPI003F7248BE
MFSIIVPLYNKEVSILKTLASVLEQTVQDFEIILINDGSTDRSLELVQTVDDRRVRIIEKENGGVSSARNVGIEIANFEYIAFLDADDLWDRNYLEIMKGLILAYPECGMFASAYREVYLHKNRVIGSDLKEGVVEDYFREMINQTIIWTSATIVRKNVFTKVGNFPIGMVSGEDTYVWAKIACKFKVAFTPNVLASYLIDNSGSSLRKGRLDSSSEQWSDLLKEGEYFRNEYIAKKALLAGIRYALGGFTNESLEIEKRYSYTRLFRRRYRVLHFLNRYPVPGVCLYNSYFKVKRWVSSI